MTVADKPNRAMVDDSPAAKHSESKLISIPSLALLSRADTKVRSGASAVPVVVPASKILVVPVFATAVSPGAGGNTPPLPSLLSSGSGLNSPRLLLTVPWRLSLAKKASVSGSRERAQGESEDRSPAPAWIMVRTYTARASFSEVPDSVPTIKGRDRYR